MNDNTSRIRLLQASIDEGDEPSHFRFLVDGQFVKYIAIDPNLYAPDDMAFAPALIPSLPPFPAGDWNQGRISLDHQSGRPHFAQTIKEQFPGVTRTWHPTTVEYVHLTMGKKLRSNVYETTAPRFRSTVVAKFAIFPWEIPHLDAETAAYEWIEGKNIGPQFLGHLTEGGRVIGFLMDRIPDAQHAGQQDLPACRDVLSRLHQLGIKHGDINRHNFLVHDGRATLVDFDGARRCKDPECLKDELRGLEQQLMDTSGRGGSTLEIASVV